MPPKKMTPANHARYSQMVRQMYETLADFRHPDLARTILPAEWREIGTDAVPDKTRITLRVDTYVAKFYRKLGREYQATMNRVLRAFMLARLTQILSEPDRVDLDTVDELGEAELIAEASLRDELDAMRRRRIRGERSVKENVEDSF